ncbi:SGNH hydrolase-type esterase domain-containing protein [Chytriomyces sp. MP71]|nr:SGNH hydrolase-type esterase domain-containing protein [Chytriomyces sp. MP71]
MDPKRVRTWLQISLALAGIATVVGYLFLMSGHQSIRKRLVEVPQTAAAEATLDRYQPNIPDLSYEQIVLVGDSLTDWSNRDRGWGSMLANTYNRKLDVLFRAFAAYNTYWLNLALPSVLFGSRPEQIKLFTLLIGTNDANRGRTYVPLHYYTSLLRESVDILHAIAPSARILVLTPPPIAAREYNPTLSFAGVREYKDACAAAVRAWTAREGGWEARQVALLETWDVFIPELAYEGVGGAAFDPATLVHFFEDRLHFSREGHELLFWAVRKKIEEAWPELAAEALPYKIPYPNEAFPMAEKGNEATAMKAMFGNARKANHNK